ncbi:unnamed protein product [Bursaphelenchus xylophilus]|uniref:(pine wood nematode) hypothetical protein n=1 Tax=Bursaphelenchus xylophilus TaxID=6326 RepID=A0A1I7RYG7_BURXY|nr:unnamed protein product [Bursaphelenchus xylophilus]CAG9085760.1 unnamed protein product [Bursaphelenchus xylophilus]
MPVRSMILLRSFNGFKAGSFSPLRFATTLSATENQSNDVVYNHGRTPKDVDQKLENLPTDILTFLLEGKSMGQETSSAFTVKGLQDMAKYYFEKSGKLIRPKVALLMSNVCNHQVKNSGHDADLDKIQRNQYRIAMVAEMIHTASLIHDDVIDEAGTRRGKPTANVKWGNKRAVLGGDRILARATKLLCMTKDPHVISTMASIVDNLVDGEFMQLEVNPTADAITRFQHYMQKTYYKTASLFANSCLSVAILSECPVEYQQKAYEFGRHFGLSFQLVDDMLDYVASSSELGKPSVADLKQGLATAPVLFAAQEFPALNLMINRRFSENGDVEEAHRIVLESSALEQTRDLIRHHTETAVSMAKELGQCGSGDSLVKLANSQVHRER